MTKVVTILGARPQFIKAAAVSKALKAEGINEVIIHTGQHFDPEMSSIFFQEMGIPDPAINLGIHGLSHASMTGKMLVAIEALLLDEKPDIVMVYGDTNSTLAGALAARKLNIPVAHVEAGLRSFNRDMPEEINRIVTDSISDFLFCPTKTAVENAEAENLNQRAEILLTGDVMYDAMLRFKSLSKKPTSFPAQVESYILCTVHRQENTDNKSVFDRIITGLNQVASEQPIIIPAHPRIRELISSTVLHSNIHVIPPVGYLEMIYLLTHSSLVITDSGGLQKEAFFARKFCLTLREETEWVELVEREYNQLVGSDTRKLIAGVKRWSNKEIENPVPLYGSGNASEKIAEALTKGFSTHLEQGMGLPDRDLKKNLGCG